MRLGEAGDGRVGEADVEHGAGAAPGALLGAAAEREEGAGRERGGEVGHRAAGGEVGDAGEGEGDAGRDRQAEGGQAREVGGAAAVAVGADGVAGVEADDGAGQRRMISCGFIAVQHTAECREGKRKRHDSRDTGRGRRKCVVGQGLTAFC